MESDTFTVYADSISEYSIDAYTKDSVRLHQSITIYNKKVVLRDTTKGNAVLEATGGETYEWQVEGHPTSSLYTVALDTIARTYSVLIDGFCLDSVEVPAKKTINDSSKVSISIKGDAVLCFGNPADTTTTLFVDMNGGSGNFSYRWEKGDVNNRKEIIGETSNSITISTRKPEVYVAKVTDNISGLTYEAEKQIVPMIAQVYNQNEKTAKLEAIGGNSYEWLYNGQNVSIIEVPVVDTTYTVKIKRDSFVCAASVEIGSKIITTPDSIIAIASLDTAICLGSSVNLNVDVYGGSGSYDYKWNVQDSSLARGKYLTVTPQETFIYHVVVTDRKTDAQAVGSVRVEVPVVRVAPLGKDSLTLKAEGGISYKWSNGSVLESITVAKVDTYYVDIVTRYGEICTFGPVCTSCDIPCTVCPPSNKDSFSVSIIGESSICYGDTVLLKSVIEPACDTCDYSYTWGNNDLTFDRISVSPKLPTTYVLTVTNKNTKVSKTVTFKVNVMKAKLQKLDLEDRSITLSAIGGSTYSWSTGETQSSINIAYPFVDTTYSVVISNGDNFCTVQFDTTVIKPVDPFKIKIDGADICKGESGMLTLDMGVDESVYRDLKIQWRNTNETTRSIEIMPDLSTMYNVDVVYIPTNTIYSASIKVNVLNCSSTDPDPDTCQNPPCEIILPIECGQPDLTDVSYMPADNAAIAYPSDQGKVYQVNNGNFKVISIQSGKTIDLGYGASLYLESNVSTVLNLRNLNQNSTLILAGSGPYTLKGEYSDYLNVNGRLLISKGTSVVISPKYSGQVNVNLNNNSSIYNRGNLKIEGSVSNNGGSFVNMDVLTISNSADFNVITSKFTNFGILNVGNKFGDFNAGTIALEIGSVSNLNHIGNVNNDATICGRGCVHYTGNVGNINKSTGFTASEMTICKASSSNASNWGAANVTNGCDHCEFSVIAKNVEICDTAYVQRDSVMLDVQVSGGSGSYSYTIFTESDTLTNTLDHGGRLYAISCPVVLSPQFPLSEAYKKEVTVVVADRKYAGLVDTVTAKYVINNCGGNIVDKKDTFSVKIMGDDQTICKNHSTLLKANVTMDRNGNCTYKWSTNEYSKEITVAPSEDTMYWLEVTYKDKEETRVLRDSVMILVKDCYVPDSCRNLYNVTLEDPTCNTNGKATFVVYHEELNIIPVINWYDSQNRLISTSNEIGALSAGKYSVNISYGACQEQKDFELKTSVHNNKSGFQKTYYGKANDSAEDCPLSDKGESLIVKDINQDLSTIDASYVTWTGFIKPSCNGLHTFYFNDTIVNSSLLVDSKRVENGSSVNLESGRSYMIAYVVKRSGVSSNKVYLKWETPCEEVSSIPSCAVIPDPMDGLLVMKDSISGLENCSTAICNKPIIPLSPTRSICIEGEPIILDATVPGATYKWTLPDGSETNEASISVSKSGIYKIDMTSWCGEKNSMNVLVQTKAEVGVSATASTNDACYGSKVKLKAKGGVSYAWSPVEGLDNPRSAEPSFIAETKTNYTVRIKTAGGCFYNETVTVDVKDSFNIEVEPLIKGCFGEPVQLKVSGAEKYTWHPIYGLSCEHCDSPSYMIISDSVSFVVYGSKDGCILSKQVTVMPYVLSSDLDFEYTVDKCSVNFEAPKLEGYAVSSYNWEFENSKKATGSKVSHEFASTGTFNVRLSVVLENCKGELSFVYYTKEIVINTPCTCEEYNLLMNK